MIIVSGSLKNDDLTLSKEEHFENDESTITLTACEDSIILLLTQIKLQEIKNNLKLMFQTEKKALGDVKDLKVVKKIGAGSYGTVYVCKHITNEKLYAVKKLDRKELQSLDLTENLKKEIDVMK